MFFFVFFLGEVTAEETYDRLFTVTSRVSLAVTKEDDGVPVDCIIDHPAAKDLLAQRHLRVLCELPPLGLFFFSPKSFQVASVDAGFLNSLREVLMFLPETIGNTIKFRMITWEI